MRECLSFLKEGFSKKKLGLIVEMIVMIPQGIVNRKDSKNKKKEEAGKKRRQPVYVKNSEGEKNLSKIGFSVVETREYVVGEERKGRDGAGEGM
jgi:hypothetical protein